MKNSHQIPKVLLTYSIVSSVSLLLINIFRWQFIDILTPFLLPFVEILVYVVFLVAFIWSLFYFPKKLKNFKKSAIPFAINLFVLLVIIFVPFTDIATNIDYYWNLSEREKVVDMVLNDQLRSNVPYSDSVINLPQKYKKLSKGGGEIIVVGEKSNRQILFFTYRGVIDNMAGFIHTNGANPDETMFQQTFFKSPSITIIGTG